NDLLPWRNAAEHFFAERLFFDPCDELLRDLEIDIGFQQREPDLPERVINVGLTDRPVSAKILEDVLKLIAELRKHIASVPWSARASRAGFGASPKPSLV